MHKHIDTHPKAGGRARVLPSAQVLLLLLLPPDKLRPLPVDPPLRLALAFYDAATLQSVSKK